MADQEGKEEQRPEQQADDAEMMARLRQEIENLPVSEHVVYMMHSLSTLAIGRLGLTSETAARRDLSQARLAIDAFKALLGTLEQSLPAAEVSAHRGMLSQIQLAYAGVTDRADTAAGDDSADAQPSPAPAEEIDSSGEQEPEPDESESASGDDERKAAPKAAKSRESSGARKPVTGARKTSSAAKKKSAGARKTAKPGKNA